ncbi:hypothetical protein [Pseudolysinimonas sp.]|uniref:hypothetical protein n=1 Tax=Pseudolysinimonas sp. TaxID=2680009 RepID=UPI0032630CDA
MSPTVLPSESRMKAWRWGAAFEQQAHTVEIEEQKPGRIELRGRLDPEQPGVELSRTIEVIGVLGD